MQIRSRSRIMRMAALLCAAGMLSSGVSAFALSDGNDSQEHCSERTLHGTYGSSPQGSIPPAPRPTPY